MGSEYINALAELNINDKNAPLEVIKSKFKDIVKASKKVVSRK